MFTWSPHTFAPAAPQGACHIQTMQTPTNRSFRYSWIYYHNRFSFASRYNRTTWPIAKTQTEGPRNFCFAAKCIHSQQVLQLIAVLDPFKSSNLLNMFLQISMVTGPYQAEPSTQQSRLLSIWHGDSGPKVSLEQCCRTGEAWASSGTTIDHLI